jgi:amphi-Trp domain-containing protein
MTEFLCEERVTREQAAQRLVDIAYALTAGDTLELRHKDTQVSVPVADEVVLLRRSASTGDDRIEVDVLLSWSAPVVPEAEPIAHSG